MPSDRWFTCVLATTTILSPGIGGAIFSLVLIFFHVSLMMHVSSVVYGAVIFGLTISACSFLYGLYCLFCDKVRRHLQCVVIDFSFVTGATFVMSLILLVLAESVEQEFERMWLDETDTAKVIEAHLKCSGWDYSTSETCRGEVMKLYTLSYAMLAGWPGVQLTSVLVLGCCFCRRRRPGGLRKNLILMGSDLEDGVAPNAL